jgi:hypothetical protein
MINRTLMRGAKWIVLVGGALGILAFFVPMARFTQGGKTYAVSVYELFSGLDALDKPTATAAMTAQQKQDAVQTLTELQGVIVGCFAPGALLAIVALIALARRKFGRLGGMLAIVLGALSFLVFAGFTTVADAAGAALSKGPAMYLLAATGLLGIAGGMLVVAQPDIGPPTRGVNLST